MSPIREVFLSLSEVEEMILALERKYGVSSAEFFRDVELRNEMPEDDVFKWEAMIDHRLALRDMYQQVHSGYLAKLTHSQEEPSPIAVNQDLLAA